MPTLEHIQIHLTPEQVLQAQGAGTRRPGPAQMRLFALTEKALQIGLPALSPAAIYERYTVVSWRHDRLLLENGGSLQGALLREQLAGASAVIAAVCTVGDEVSRISAELFPTDPALALAVDGLASAAVERLGVELCRQIGQLAIQEELQAGLPLNPGMQGWPVAAGQPQIFALLDGSPIGVTLGEGAFMRPLKSLSFVVGLGKDLQAGGQSCDFCSLQNSCRYRPAGGHGTPVDRTEAAAV